MGKGLNYSKLIQLFQEELGKNILLNNFKIVKSTKKHKNS